MKKYLFVISLLAILVITTATASAVKQEHFTFMAKDIKQIEGDFGVILLIPDIYGPLDFEGFGGIYKNDVRVGIGDVYKMTETREMRVVSDYFQGISFYNWEGFLPVDLYLTTGEIITIAGFNNPKTRKSIEFSNLFSAKAYSFHSYKNDDRHGPGLVIKAPELARTLTIGVPIKVKTFHADEVTDGFIVAEDDTYVSLHSIFFGAENIKEWKNKLPTMVVSEEKHEFIIYRAVVWNDLKF